jgi:hypothetical protein
VDDAVAVEPGVGRDFERCDPTDTPDRNATTGEQMLAGIIADYWKPVAPGDDLYADAGDENVEAIARAHIYRILTDRSFHELERHLVGSPAIRRLLGVDTVLNHNSYSRSWRVQFSETNRQHLRTICETVREQLAALDVAEVEPFLADEDRIHTARERITDAQKRRCVNNVWGLFDDVLDFDRGPGIEWSTQYLYDVFAEGATKGITPYEVLDKERKESEDASLKAVMNAVDQRSADEWIDVFDDMFQRVFDRLHAVGWFTREVDAYVDGTTRPMWPTGELPEGVKGGDVKESTNYAWQFATLVVEERGIQVPVAVVPITDEVAPEDQLEMLLDQAEGRVKIDVLQADGAYGGARPQQVVKQSSLVNDYIFRGTRRSDEVKRRLVTMTGLFGEGGQYVTTSADHQVRAESRLVADPDWNNATEEWLNTVPDSGQFGISSYSDDKPGGTVVLDDVDKKYWQARRPYYTSLTEEQASAKEVTEMYDDRWIVEDNYANTKRNQLGKTDSPNHAIQTFVFCLGMLFSVAWTACRVFLREDYPDCVPHDRPIISAREIVVFVRLEYG